MDLPFRRLPLVGYRGGFDQLFYARGHEVESQLENVEYNHRIAAGTVVRIGGIPARLVHDTIVVCRSSLAELVDPVPVLGEQAVVHVSENPHLPEQYRRTLEASLQNGEQN